MERLSAGSYRAWRVTIEPALRGEGESSVPCGECTACCRSSQFVFVGADEHDALTHIPKALRFPAPRHPGAFVMGYDKDGRCPMLGDDGCTIYEHRPMTCRTYDCRVFAATGVTPDQPLIAAQVARWEFDGAIDPVARVHDDTDAPALHRALEALRDEGTTLA
ncbi:MAG: YkgJ family cysteine cluster protein [Acidimicrobiia bacterium]